MNLRELLNDTCQFEASCNMNMEVVVLDESEASECLLISVKEVRLVEGKIALILDA